MLRLLSFLIGLAFVAACTPVPPALETRTERAPQAETPFTRAISRVEEVAERECASQRQDANCDFLFLVDDRRGQPPNAYQTEDVHGRPIIAITTPLIRAARNEDEMAFVAAHEAAHHILGHIDIQYRNAEIGAEILGRIESQSASATPRSIAEAQQVGAIIGARKYSKEFELEADVLGAKITALAGYDAMKGAEFFFRLPDPGDEFLGTHPANAARVTAVRAAVASL